MADLSLELAGQPVLATVSRALVWEKTVFIADVHFGKDATFRSANLWTPPGAVEDNLSRLSALLDTHHARRLVILGDVFHSTQAAESVPAIRRWRDRRKGCEILVVAGNHDRHAGEIAAGCGFQMEPEGISLGPWTLRHHPQTANSGFVLCGHIHPMAVMQGPGRQRLRLPCFLLSPTRCILPAFGAFTGGQVVRPQRHESLLAIAGDTVMRMAIKT